MFKWLNRVMRGQAGLRDHAPHITPIAQHNDFFWTETSRTDTRIYHTSPWVYVAINRIAEAAALAPLNVFALEGEARIAVANHPLEQLLNCPNPFMSRFELFEQTIGMLELMGNAYWFLTGNAAGEPIEIWPLRADRVRIIPDEKQYIAGYVYELDGQHMPMSPVEVVHFKRWHPANDYYGLSAIEAARIAIDSDNKMARWNQNTFGKDNGVPAGIVNIQEFVSDADFERIKREWRQSYGGPQRKTAFLRGGSIEWHNIGLSHTDMDFLKGREANRDEILNIFGVPIGLISENATEANAKVAERVFIERTLWPKLVRISQKITQELLPFWSGEAVAMFEDIRPTDTQARLEEIRTAHHVMSINEIRERYYHLEPVLWGELPPVGDFDVPPATSASISEGEDCADATKAILTELAQWERFALKRWDQPDARPFETHIVPDAVAFEIKAGLMLVESEADVKNIFTEAKRALA